MSADSDRHSQAEGSAILEIATVVPEYCLEQESVKRF